MYNWLLLCIKSPLCASISHDPRASPQPGSVGTRKRVLHMGRLRPRDLAARQNHVELLFSRVKNGMIYWQLCMVRPNHRIIFHKHRKKKKNGPEEIIIFLVTQILPKRTLKKSGIRALCGALHHTVRSDFTTALGGRCHWHHSPSTEGESEAQRR